MIYPIDEEDDEQFSEEEELVMQDFVARSLKLPERSAVINNRYDLLQETQDMIDVFGQPQGLNGGFIVTGPFGTRKLLDYLYAVKRLILEVGPDEPDCGEDENENKKETSPKRF